MSVAACKERYSMSRLCMSHAVEVPGSGCETEQQRESQMNYYALISLIVELVGALG